MNSITVTAAICPKCHDKIYSRATHDFHSCSCGEIAVDGGFDYLRLCFPKIKPETIEINIDATKEELYIDWNKGINKFGIIKNNE